MNKENNAPRTGAESVAPTSDTKPQPVLVLLCGGLARNVPNLDLTGVAKRLSQQLEGLQVRLVTDLCSKPGGLKDGLRDADALGLVLGLCGQDYPEFEAQGHARKARIDPFGIQPVNLAAACGEDSPSDLANARATLVLGAAVARARAFPGSQPENKKPVVLSSDQPISRRALFTQPPLSYVSIPSVLTDRCAAVDGCDLCVEGCPYDALEKSGENILVDSSQCRSCGVCVAVCPRRAVELPGWSAEELEAQLAYLLGAKSELAVRQVAFVCKNTTVSADAEWLPVSVPCISMVSVELLLQSIARGATAAAVLPCSSECPTGMSQVFRERIDYCRNLLSVLGGPSEANRVQLLGTDDRSQTGKIPEQAPPAAEASTRPSMLFGIGVAADAIRALSQRYGADGVMLEHKQSPLGLVKIDKDACTGCLTCAIVCPTDAISADQQQTQVSLVFDHSACVACGLCVTLCPERAEGAIEVQRVTDLNRLDQGRQVVFTGEESLCERCGAPVAPRRMVERIAEILGDDFDVRHMGSLCVKCRRM